MLLSDALERALLQFAADGRSPHTVSQYRRHVRLLATWLDQQGHSSDVRELDDCDIAQFLCSPEATTRPDGRAKAAGSTNSLRTSLRCFFTYLERAGVVERSPARLVRLAVTPPPPPRELRPREEEKLRAVLEAAQGFEADRDRVLFELLLSTGIRLSSALALDVEDVDLDEGVLHLRVLKRGGQQQVFLTDRTRDMLAEFLGDGRRGPVFQSVQGRRITGRHAQRRFRAWRDSAGLPRTVTPHGLRHTFATRLYERTGDLLLVQRALGHRSITSTMVYAQVDDERLRSAFAQEGCETGPQSLKSGIGGCLLSVGLACTQLV